MKSAESVKVGQVTTGQILEKRKTDDRLPYFPN